MESLREYLKGHRLITDGAMGTYYSEITNNPEAFAEFANIERPDIIERIHNEYIDAGAKLIRTNTFAANTQMLGIGRDELKKLIEDACRIAQRCADGRAYVAGDIGPIKENAESEGSAVEEYKMICDIFLDMKVDAIRFETFADFDDIKEVAEYVRSKSDMFIMADFCLNKNGFTAGGISAARIMQQAGQMDCIDSCGFNCGIGSGHMNNIMQKLTFAKDKYMSCLPNAGYPEQMNNRMVFMNNASYFCDNMQKISAYGMNIIGGCCGTKPAYIRELCRRIGDAVPAGRTETSDGNEPVNGNNPAEAADIRVNEKRPNEFMQLFKSGHKVVAVELDPPYDAKYDRLIEQAQYLKSRGVDILTFADSPMGRSRVDSVLMSLKVTQETGMMVMPHVCCRDKNVIAMRSTLLGTYINGIRQLLLVTGDPVPSVSRVSTTGVFDYNSIRLMNFVKEMNQEHFADEPLYYGGALNVTLGRIDRIMERMQKKIDNGASYFMTQPVFSKEGIERLAIIKEKMDTKILCGIMPLVSYRNANFIKNEFIGIDVPDEIVARYSPDMSKEEGEAVGAQIANELIGQMYDYVDGFYFMLPFNRVSLMDKININNR